MSSHAASLMWCLWYDAFISLDSNCFSWNDYIIYLV